MKINGYQLTYCTNIHPGETLEEVEQSLKQYIPQVKAAVCPEDPFGIGLRLSDQASRTLHEPGRLQQLKKWLEDNNCYVFTLNGFPYGGFHRQVVKDKVHQPDWTTPERLNYTIRLFDILSGLIPEGVDGGISTSPLSYRYWHSGNEAMEHVKQTAARHLVQVALHLHEMKQQKGQDLHLDIEPEPDGILENTEEVISFFMDYLVPGGVEAFRSQYGVSAIEAEKYIKRYIRVCYDVCHFAVVFEEPKQVFNRLAENGIQVGKIQISAALKVDLPQDAEQRKAAGALLKPFAESTYLHQVVGRKADGSLRHYPDLPAALDELEKTTDEEWRTHFHVPVFLDNYGKLTSTRQDIVEVLRYLRHNQVTTHLEVETYTWEVLPDDIQLKLEQSLVRELEWVIETMQST